MKNIRERDPSGTKILVIDDDLLMRKSIAKVLHGIGYEVMMAENGREGLEIYRREKPDLILLDLRMPVMDGIEVLESLEDDLNELPVIIVSGAGAMDDAVQTVKLGAWDYILKPIKDVKILAHSIDKALDRAALIKENKRYQNYLEEEIKIRTAELHQAQKMEAIGTLAGGIAHDFNNILAIMTGYSQMAMEQLPADSQAYQDLEKVMKAGQRATELVKQILTFSRQVEQTMQPVQLQFILKEALKLLRASLPATIEIREDIDMNCPPVLADPADIHQVIMNLCGNAKHAMLEKGGLLKIELSQGDRPPETFRTKNGTAEKNSYIILRVADTGPGIPRENLHRIFDPFFTTKPVNQGTGLGLSVVHGIVNKLNGDIQVTSTEGQGADFQMVFPAARVDKNEIQPDDLYPVTGDEHILVVDDDPEISSMMERVLTRLGYRVRAFSDSIEALDDFRRNHHTYDLVVTDMTMPGLTGKQLAEAILEQQPDMPIVMCTGFSEILDKKQAEAIGIREYLMKPVVKNELARIIRKVLNDG